MCLCLCVFLHTGVSLCFSLCVYLLTLNSVTVSHCVIVSASVSASVSITVFTNQYVLHDPHPRARTLLQSQKHAHDHPFRYALSWKPPYRLSIRQETEGDYRQKRERDLGTMSHWVSGHCLCGGCWLQRLTSPLPSSPYHQNPSSTQPHAIPALLVFFQPSKSQ